MKEKLNYLLVAVFAVLLVAVFVYFANPRHVQQMQAGFLGMISPFLKEGSGLKKQYTGLRDGMQTLDQLNAEVKRLRVVNKELSATNQMLRGLEAENNRLRASLGYREHAVFQLMPARIIARDPSTWYQKIIIDRGKAELIESDMPVLTPEGLVGKTTVISDHSCEVLLLTDENCRVSAVVEGAKEASGARVQGIVKGERATGQGQPVIGLGFLSKQANLHKNMNVYTSGVGGVFPSGIPIGAVDEYRVRELDSFATITPAVDLSNIEDVFVVVGETK
jgi:rod shape-determining protein MreC